MESATPFRLKAPRDSEGLRHVIPREGAHPFRAMTPSDSEGLRPPVPMACIRWMLGSEATRDNARSGSIVGLLGSSNRGGNDASGAVIHAEDSRGIAVEFWGQTEPPVGGAELRDGTHDGAVHIPLRESQ